MSRSTPYDDYDYAMSIGDDGKTERNREMLREEAAIDEAVEKSSLDRVRVTASIQALGHIVDALRMRPEEHDAVIESLETVRRWLREVEEER